MPRRTRPRRRVQHRWQSAARADRDPEDLARDLVRRGLATPLILFDDNRRRTTQEEESAC